MLCFLAMLLVPIAWESDITVQRYRHFNLMTHWDTFLTLNLTNAISTILVLCVTFFCSNHSYHSSRYIVYQFGVYLLGNLITLHCNTVP